MSNKQGRKRKPTPLLDYEVIKAKAAANNSYLGEVRERIAAVNDVDLQRLLSVRLPVSEEEALQLLASKLSVTGLCNLRTVLRHVPDNITRIINGVPLRATLVHKLFTSMVTANQYCSNLSVDDMSLYMNFAERIVLLLLV